MQRPSYRYRPIHSLAELLINLAARLVSSHGDFGNDVPCRILVLKFGGMGEAVLARSIVESLRQRNPAMSFDYLIEQRTEEVMTFGTQGTVFKYLPQKDGIRKALRTLFTLRRHRYDAILDFEQDSLLTAAFVRATSIPIRVGFSPSPSHPRGRMFTHTIDLRPTESMWSSFIRIGRILDKELPEALITVPLPVPPIAAEDWRSLGIEPSHRGHVVAMHLGVGPSAQYRRWPVERFVELATAIAKYDHNLTVILTGSKSEEVLIRKFQDQFPGISVNASSVGSLDRVAGVLRGCDLLVCADTGIMHLAAAMGTPTVGLFGPNTPSCWAPVGPRATYVYKTRLPCSQCINSYLRQIPAKCVAPEEGACMTEIDVKDVLKAARSVIREPWLE